jgi:heptosyltransferase II
MKLLIELPSWIGDCVMLTPAFENLISHYSNPKITTIGTKASVEILKNHPNVVKNYVLAKKYIPLIKQVSTFEEFDVFISFRSSFRSTFLKLLVSAKNKQQFNKNKYKNRHVVEKYNDFVNDILEENMIPGSLLIYQGAKSNINTTDLVVGINPGAAYGEAKRWNSEKFAQLATTLSANYKIMIFGGSNEVDIALKIEKILLKNGINNFENLAGMTSIQELIKLISQLKLFVTGDSGPMHIAASFHVPTVAIFGPTKDCETSQWMNSNSIIVKKELSCQPCMKRSCPLGHNNCMNLIEVNDVLNAVNSLD